MVYRLGYGQPRYSIQTTEVFDEWFESLKDRRAKARIQARIDRAEDGNFGDCEPVGEGVSDGSSGRHPPGGRGQIDSIV